MQAIDLLWRYSLRRQDFCEWKRPEGLELIVENERLPECMEDLKPGEQTSTTSDWVKAVIQQSASAKICLRPCCDDVNPLGKSENLLGG